MNDNQFDEFFRNKLEKFASNVPGDMWQRINKKDKDRKGVVLPRWYWFALLVLFIGVGGYFVLNNNSNEKVESNLAKKENATNKKSDQNKSAEETVNKNSIAEINDNDDAKIASAKDTSNISKTTKKITKQKTLTNNNTSFSSNQISATDNIPSTDKNDNFNGIAINKSNQVDSSTSKISVIKKPATDSSATADENSNDPKKNEDENLDKFSLEVFSFFPPSISFDNINSTNKIYEQQLKDASKIRYTIWLGARLDVKITKKISGKIGVQYTLINEKLNTTSDSLMGQISSSNFYKSLDVPILLSYTTNIKSSVTASVTSGIILNLVSTYKGLIPDPYGGIADIKTDNVYNRNNGVSIYLGIGLSKNVKPNLDVFAQPHFIYRTKSMTNSLQSFDRKINTLGIEFGLRYKLFKKQDE